MQVGAFLKSTIGRKVVVGLSGLALIGFLVLHLLGNLLVFKGPEAFNHYAHVLVSNPLLKLAEIGLLFIFLAHVLTAAILTLLGRRARPVSYTGKHRAGHTSRKSVASSTMIWTGLVTLVFVVLHLKTFKWGPMYGSAGDPAVRDLYRLVLEIFAHPGYVAWYGVAMFLLGFHLSHGVSSAFESLGFGHRRGLRGFGVGLAFLLAAGFASVPLVIFFGGKGS